MKSNIKTINVLITAVGGDIGQGVFKSLRSSGRKIRIFGTDISAKAPGLFMVDKGYIITAATKNKNQYINELIAICKKEKIDIVFSCHEEEQFAISLNLKKLKKMTKSYFLIQPLKIMNVCRDKFLTYQFLKSVGIRVPESAINKFNMLKLIKKFNFPLIIKPRRGSGSRDFYLIKNRQELSKYWLKIKNPVVQEYISNEQGDEFTVGVFLDEKSKALSAISMLRELRFGLTFYGIVDNYPDVTQLAIKAAESLKTIGLCNVQLRKDQDNKPCVIEVNPRFSSTAIFRAKLGFNEAAAAIDYFLMNREPNLKFKKGVVVMKTWDELIVARQDYEKLKKNGKIINQK
jgi:carbamoyl-phosphate synthase large subunit